MPKVTIWIRENDYPKWQAIADKPEWLHEHLDMPKATKDGYRSEHFYSVPADAEEITLNGVFDEPTVTEPEDTA